MVERITLHLSLKFTDQLKGIKIDDNFYYIAVNSTKVLDSHEDLHLDGIWKKTIKEQQGKNYLVTDHDLEIKSVVVRKEHIEMFTAKVPFSLIGKPYEGDTEVLIYKVPKNQVKCETVKDWLNSGDSIEGSVRMQYVKFSLCLYLLKILLNGLLFQYRFWGKSKRTFEYRTRHSRKYILHNVQL